MTIVNGQPVNETTFNSGFVSRNSDTDTTGKIDLKNADSDDIIDLQGSYNDHDHNGTNSEKVLATTLDTTGGGADQVLVADGSGSSTWEDQSGGGAGVGSLSIYGVSQADSVQYTEFTDNTTNASFGEESTNPLSGLKSYKLTNATGAATESIYTLSEDVEERSKGKSNVASLVYSYDGDDDDISVQFYDVTNAAILETLSLKAGESINAHMNGYIADTCNNVQCRVIVETANNGKELIFDDISFNDEPFTYGTLQEKNEFSARIANNGTAAITSQGGLDSSGNNAIASVQRNATGIVQITWTTDFFSITPLVIPANHRGDAGTGEVVVGTCTTTYCNINVSNSAGTLQDKDFGVMIQRQGTDYKQLSENIITPTKANSNNGSIRIRQPSGNGSTDTRIRRFTYYSLDESTTNIALSSGEYYSGDRSIKVTDSAANGTYFTIMQDGVYHMSYSDVFSSTVHLGISKNSTNLTSDVSGLGSDLLQIGRTQGNNVPDVVSITEILSARDIIRPHVEGATVGANPEKSIFTITRIGGTQLSANLVPQTAILTYETTSEQASSTNTTQTVGINTLDGDTSFLSLSSNQFTLPKGTYDYDFSQIFYTTDGSQVHLYDVTNSAIEKEGQSGYAYSVGAVATNLIVKDRLVLTESTTYEVRAYTQRAATNGLGISTYSMTGNSSTTNVYLTGSITKIK